MTLSMWPQQECGHGDRRMTNDESNTLKDGGNSGMYVNFAHDDPTTRSLLSQFLLLQIPGRS